MSAYRFKRAYLLMFLILILILLTPLSYAGFLEWLKGITGKYVYGDNLSQLHDEVAFYPPLTSRLQEEFSVFGGDKTATDLYGKTITLTQAPYEFHIVRATSDGKNLIIKLVNTFIKVPLNVGQSKTVSLAGKNYEVSLLNVTPDNAQFTINGQAAGKIAERDFDYLFNEIFVSASSINATSAALHLIKTLMELRDSNIEDSFGYDEIKINDIDIENTTVIIKGKGSPESIQIDSLELINFNVEKKCIDSDGGVNIHQKGVCKDPSGSFEDFISYSGLDVLVTDYYCDTFRHGNTCRKARDLLTYYGNLGPYGGPYKCSFGGFDGACTKGSGGITINKSGEYMFNMTWYRTASTTKINMVSPNNMFIAEYYGYNPPLGGEKSLGYLNTGDNLLFSLNEHWHESDYGPVYSNDPTNFKIQKLKENHWQFKFEGPVRWDRNYNDGTFEIYLKETSDETSECIDSDNSVDYTFEKPGFKASETEYPGFFIKGTVVDSKYGTFEDSCLGDEINEMFCTNGIIASLGIQCPNGCKDGACIKEEKKCSAELDKVCPSICSAGSDADCCIQSGKCWLDSCRDRACIPEIKIGKLGPTSARSAVVTGSYTTGIYASDNEITGITIDVNGLVIVPANINKNLGTWSASVSLTEGWNRFYVLANDKIGNFANVTSSSQEASILSDTTQPTINLISPNNGSLVSNNSQITFNILDSSLVDAFYTINGGITKSFHSIYELVVGTSDWIDGANYIIVNATDKLNNVEIKNFTFIFSSKYEIILSASKAAAKAEINNTNVTLNTLKSPSALKSIIEESPAEIDIAEYNDTIQTLDVINNLSNALSSIQSLEQELLDVISTEEDVNIKISNISKKLDEIRIIKNTTVKSVIVNQFDPNLTVDVDTTTTSNVTNELLTAAAGLSSKDKENFKAQSEALRNKATVVNEVQRLTKTFLSGRSQNITLYEINIFTNETRLGDFYINVFIDKNITGNNDLNARIDVTNRITKPLTVVVEDPIIRWTFSDTRGEKVKFSIDRNIPPEKVKSVKAVITTVPTVAGRATMGRSSKGILVREDSRERPNAEIRDDGPLLIELFFWIREHISRRLHEYFN